MAAERSGRWQEAKHAWQRAHAIAPDALQPLMSLASIAARMREIDEAFVWIDKAYSGCWAVSYFDVAYLRADEDYGVLHDDPRWETLLTQLTAECEVRAADSRRRPTDLDPQSAPAFNSHRQLTKVFARTRKELQSSQWRLSTAESTTRFATLRDQRIGALHRYLAEHPKALDRAAAAWDVVETRVSHRYVANLYSRWGAFGAQLLEEIDTFLRNYSESAQCGHASLVRAFIAFGVRPEGGTAERPWRDEDMVALDQSLADLSRKFTVTTAAGLALVWRLNLALSSSGEITPGLQAMKAQLDNEYRRDREVQRLLVETGTAAGMRIANLEAFDATDLSGSRWTSSSFKGKVTLIVFWATWCGPCVGEIPTIRTAWKTHHENGLTVLGVSLDFDDRAQFEGWLARNDVAWPQIWDGKGFSTPLAKRYDVRTIPFTVLINRDGHVTNANLRGGALLARINVLLDLPN